MNTHYTKEQLDMYRNKDMALLSRMNCACHLEVCEECRELLKTLKESDTLLNELRCGMEIFKNVQGK